MAAADDKKTIESLRAELAEKVNVVTSLERQLADKNESLTQARDNEAVTVNQLAQEREAHRKSRSNEVAANRALEEEKAAHAETRDERDQAVADAQEAADAMVELNRRLALSKTASASEPELVTHDGITYQVAVPQFNLKGKVYKAEEVTEGSELLKELVRLKSNVLAVHLG